jgi:toxin YoeB
MRAGTGLVTRTMVYTKHAQKDAKQLAGSGLKQKAVELLDILKANPFQNPPAYEKLAGDLTGIYSRRINVQHRLAYQVLRGDTNYCVSNNRHLFQELFVPDRAILRVNLASIR